MAENVKKNVAKRTYALVPAESQNLKIEQITVQQKSANGAPSVAPKERLGFTSPGAPEMD